MSQCGSHLPLLVMMCHFELRVLILSSAGFRIGNPVKMFEVGWCVNSMVETDWLIDHGLTRLVLDIERR